MDARLSRVVILLCVFSSLGADYATRNFVVTAPNAAFAKKVALAAEDFRRDLAVQWLGHELEPWAEKCPISVRIEPQAGGQTSFGFATDGRRSRPIGWEMIVFGSPERILDSVLPHEITHTIFATHFGRPLPRWADEGACTTVEHASERDKNQQNLFVFLNTKRGIAFNVMFSMKQYPEDIYPLYAQGYSVARFLIMKGGHQRFVKFVEYGLEREIPGQEPRAWDAATEKFYHLKDLSELQVTWMQWVRQGCPQIVATPPAIADADAKSTIPVAAAPATSSPDAERMVADATGASWYHSGAPQANGSPAELESQPLTIDGAALTISSEGYRPGSIGREANPRELISPVAATVANSSLKPKSSRDLFAAPPHVIR